MDEYYRAIRSLPSWLAHPLGQLPPGLAAQIHELRLRTGCGIYLTIQGKQQPLSQLPQCPPTLRGMTLTPLQMEELFHTLCAGSVHTHQTELEQGFLTTALGCRVGVAGRFADREGKLVLQKITSLNFRISRTITDPVPEKLRPILQEHFVGMLIVGEPNSGKTTLLRQIAACLGQLRQNAAVIDERGEMFPAEMEKIPPEVDVLSGVPKQKGIQMALRTLSPQVILLDELGGLDEVMALEQGFFGGADFVASLHAPSVEEALRRPQVQYLQQHQMLRVMVLLQGRSAPGQVKEICRC